MAEGRTTGSMSGKGVRNRITTLGFKVPDPFGSVEWLWRHLKEVELRNLACRDLDELHLELHLALGRIRQRSRLVGSFFEGAGLRL
jgi:hypothetical protein